MDNVLALPPFEKVVPNRKNAKHPVLKKEAPILNFLKELKSQGRIDDDLHNKIKLRSSKPTHLYGLYTVGESWYTLTKRDRITKKEILSRMIALKVK